MSARAPSPALSENAVDITGGLLGDDSDLESAEDEGSASARTGALQKQEGTQQLVREGSSDDEEFIALAQAGANRKSSNLKGKTVKKGGGFQAMGLNSKLLKAITEKGFSVPTPIQRKTIPLIMGGQDVVGMARTGSGKTAAFVIPMIEKLKVHSAKVGARAIILSPSRELALQTLGVVKEFRRKTDLRCVLLVGGDSLEQQFSEMATNPDIVIATPGRFQHLKIEMGLDLSSIQYVVFDEADRLFEMGFAPQLHEILYALPEARQTLLFSATLPSSLVDFAKAGLHEPQLIRLDAEHKISPDLQSAFFSLETEDKEGALLHIIHDLIKIPTGPTEAAQKVKADKETPGKKRKRGEDHIKPNQTPTEFSTIIFTATQHHVEYISTLLRHAGFAVSHIYGKLDQTARKIQSHNFRSGMSHIMVVTDVAARGIDIPILANVINYDFPSKPKVFVHRVGRTARAGQRGWSYNLVPVTDVPFLLDLQLFLGKRLFLGRQGVGNASYTDDITFGSLSRNRLSDNSEWVGKMLSEEIDLSSLKGVARKGEIQYRKQEKNSASKESAKRAKEITASKSYAELHPLFEEQMSNVEVEREKMLARVNNFRPQETIFEIGKRGSLGQAGEVVKKRRQAILAKKRKLDVINGPKAGSDDEEADRLERKVQDPMFSSEDEAASDSDDGLEITVTETAPLKAAGTARDEAVYMSYRPTTINEHEDRAYGVHSGSTQDLFLAQARRAAMDLTNDESGKGFGQSGAVGKRWDKRHKKYVSRANDEDGSKGQRMIRGESGAKIPASLKSGRYDSWKKSNRLDRLPRTGEAESKAPFTNGSHGRRWKYSAERTPKAPDKARDDYYKQKKKFDAAKEKRIGEFKEGTGKNELKGARDVQKDRALKAKRREKTSRPSKKMKR